MGSLSASSILPFQSFHRPSFYVFAWNAKSFADLRYRQFFYRIKIDSSKLFCISVSLVWPSFVWFVLVLAERRLIFFVFNDIFTIFSLIALFVVYFLRELFFFRNKLFLFFLWLFFGRTFWFKYFLNFPANWPPTERNKRLRFYSYRKGWIIRILKNDWFNEFCYTLRMDP